MTPLKRYINLLSLDKKDVFQIFGYALFSGLISLTLPLGIQAIINFIQAGRASVAWIVLVVLVIIGVVFGGLLSIMQLRITENLQQKIFIRSAFEFSYRIPKLLYKEIYNKYAPELSNRFFDTISIQKGTSKLLIDFSSALLQIVFGILLLSFYHPFFILFGVLVVLLLYFIFKISYKPGLKTSLQESNYKYKVASWLQELARNFFSFKNPIHLNFALEKNNRLVNDYLENREKHFAIIKRQYAQLVAFKALISASLLLIGGFLVINQQMNIGQFVAAEIIILLVINSVEKIILGLESLYDVLTSVEKIGQVTDLGLESDKIIDNPMCHTNISVALENVSFQFYDATSYALKDVNLKINQGEKIVIDGDNGSGKTTLIRILCGLIEPTAGNLKINDDSYTKMDINEYRTHFGSLLQGEKLFEGTIYENLTFNSSFVTPDDLKWALDGLQLSEFVKSLPNGLQTQIYSDGKQLSSSNIQKILLARCILNKPRILFLENPTSKMDANIAKQVIDFISHPSNPWTLIVSSKNHHWKDLCNRIIIMNNGKIESDQKK